MFIYFNYILNIFLDVFEKRRFCLDQARSYAWYMDDILVRPYRHSQLDSHALIPSNDEATNDDVFVMPDFIDVLEDLDLDDVMPDLVDDFNPDDIIPDLVGDEDDDTEPAVGG